MKKEKDPQKYFAKPRPASFAVNFRDPEGFAGTICASTWWTEDGEYMAIWYGLKEIGLSKEEMVAVRDAITMAIEARQEYDAAFSTAE